MCLLFIPSCVVVELAIAPLRYRTFTYDSYEDVTHFRYLRYLPPGAKEIRIRQKGNGHDAVFSITNAELDAWYEEATQNAASMPHAFFTDLNKVSEFGSQDEHAWLGDFKQLDWEQPDKALLYEGPTELDGGGSTLLFDPATSTAFQSVGIW